MVYGKKGIQSNKYKLLPKFIKCKTPLFHKQRLNRY